MYLPYQSFTSRSSYSELTHWVLNWMKNTLLFTYGTNIVVRLLTVTFLPQKSENVRPHSSNSIETQLKRQPHYSQTSRENTTPSSGTSPLHTYVHPLLSFLIRKWQKPDMVMRSWHGHFLLRWAKPSAFGGTTSSSFLRSLSFIRLIRLHQVVTPNTDGFAHLSRKWPCALV